MWVDIESACQVAVFRCIQHAGEVGYHLSFGEKCKGIVQCAVECPFSGMLVGEECLLQKCHQFIVGLGIPGCDKREDVCSKNSLFSTAGCNIFVRCLDILLVEVIDCVFSFCNENCLTVRVKVWPPCSSCHLAVFPYRNGPHSFTTGIAEIVTDNNPAGREVQAGCERGS